MRFVHNRKSTEMQEDWVRTELWNASSNHLIKEGSSNIVFQMITYLYTPQIVLFLNEILKGRQFIFLYADSLKIKWAANTALPWRSRRRKISVSVLLVLLLPLSTTTARDQNRHLKIHRLISSSQQTSWGRSLPGTVETRAWRCLEAGASNPRKMARYKCREDGGLYLLVRKKDSKFLNCELPGLTHDFHFTKLKLNWQTPGSGNDLHPSLIWYLLIAPVWSVKFSRAPFYDHFSLVWTTNASFKERKCWLQEMFENLSFS